MYSKNKSIILIFILIEVPKFVDMCGWGITLLVSYGILDIKELLLVMIFVITIVAMMYHDVFAT